MVPGGAGLPVHEHYPSAAADPAASLSAQFLRTLEATDIAWQQLPIGELLTLQRTWMAQQQQACMRSSFNVRGSYEGLLPSGAQEHLPHTPFLSVRFCTPRARLQPAVLPPLLTCLARAGRRAHAAMGELAERRASATAPQPRSADDGVQQWQPARFQWSAGQRLPRKF